MVSNNRSAGPVNLKIALPSTHAVWMGEERNTAHLFHQTKITKNAFPGSQWKILNAYFLDEINARTCKNRRSAGPVNLKSHPTLNSRGVDG